MNMVLAYVVVGVTVIIAYLLGSINSSIIVGKCHGIEIREHGSKNAGLTNTLRVLGKKAAGFVLLGDILKGSEGQHAYECCNERRNFYISDPESVPCTYQNSHYEHGNYCYRPGEVCIHDDRTDTACKTNY